MIDYPHLIPECNVDTVFVEAIGYKRPNHAPSITRVSSILEKEMTKRTAVGFVDNDKRQPLYFKEFKQFKKVGNAILLKHPKKNHYLIVVNPDMDNFIFRLCKDLNINPADYDLPKNLNAFVSFTKKESIKNNPKFRNLLNTILQKKHPEVVAILTWLREIL